MKVKKEFIIFGVVIVFILGCFLFSNYKHNKPRYNKSDISIDFSESTESLNNDVNSVEQPSTETEQPSTEFEQSSNTVESSTFDNSSIDSQTESVESTETIMESTQASSDVVIDSFVVNKSNIVDVITNILSDSPNMQYCTSDIDFDASIRTYYTITGLTDVDLHYEENYMTAYLCTPSDDYAFRFDFIVDSNGKLSKLVLTQQ